MTPLQMFITFIIISLVTRISMQFMDDNKWLRVMMFILYMGILGIIASIIYGLFHYPEIINPLGVIAASVLLIILGTSLLSSDHSDIFTGTGVILNIISGISIVGSLLWATFYYITI